MFYEAREEVIKLFDYYTTIAFKAKHEAKHEKGLKILTPKKMLQRLPIVLAHIQAENTSQNLLNKFRNTIYSLH